MSPPSDEPRPPSGREPGLPAGAGRPGRRRGSLRLGLVLFALVLALVVSRLPRRLYGDDVFFVWCLVRDRVFTVHFLYMPLARAWCGALARAGVDPFLALRLLAATATAGGVALAALAARRRLGERPAADVLAAALAAWVLAAPSTWFFAGAAEIHGVHLLAFGLLAWVLAGLGPRSGAGRVLAVALAFGVAVGAHKTSVLLLPGVLAGYALLSGPRRRGRDAAAFAAGGALALALMLVSQKLQAGVATTPQDGPDYWLGGLAHHLRNAPPRFVLGHWGEAWIAPAFSLALLGAAAWGSLWRSHRAAAAALSVALLPHALVLPVFRWTERGAYFVVTLPILAWAVARAASAGGRPAAGPLPRAQRAATALLFGAAAAGGTLRPDELLELASPLGLAALGALAAAAGAAFPRHALVGSRGGAAAALALVLCQGVGAHRERAAFDRGGTPLLDWGRDTVAATAPDAARAGGEPPAAGSALICTGFQEYMLLLLLDRAWAEPWSGTWDYPRELGSLGPTPFDVGSVAPRLEDGVARLLSEGKRIFVLESVFRHFEYDPLRGRYVRALKERYALAPADRGRFRGFELLRRER